MTDRAFKVKNTLELGEYNTTIADTAVDVFVYDTSRDSDGGAWRHRTQHTSWYNETLNTATRGSRREFPAVAVIVAEYQTLTIYDGDDPSLPMWKSMTGTGGTFPAYYYFNFATSCTALDGKIVTGGEAGQPTTGGGCRILDFVNDTAELISAPYGSNIGYVTYGLSQSSLSAGDSNKTSRVYGVDVVLVNTVVNDVAMTVLPNAPIEAATGLPVPTIAVATDGGVSVITDSGAVYDLTYTIVNAVSMFVAFDGNGGIYWGSREFYSGSNSNTLLFWNESLPTADDSSAPDRIWGNTSSPPVRGNVFRNNAFFVDGNTFAISTDITGLNTVSVKDGDLAGSMVAYTTSTYNTGWMPGDIKLATLSDTDDTDLVGASLVTGDNSTFTNGTGDWSAIDPNNTTVTNPSGEMYVVSTELYEGVTLSVPTTVGATYALTRTVRGATGTLRFRTYIDSVDKGGITNIDNGAGSTETFYHTATGTTTTIKFQSWNTIASFYIDDVTFKLAEADRSRNQKGLIVNGTITKDPVATGADLVAYSGFSSTNYLEQPYNSDLDFGTGDFCIMGWVKLGSSSNQYIFDRQDGSGSSTDRLNFIVTNTRTTLFCRADNTTASVAKTLPADVWLHLAVARKSGVAYFYVDGVLAGSGALAGDNTDASASYPMTVLAQGADKLASPEAGALLRISATAPTAEQIAKIYEDEKVLFQENAQATLYGSSNTVTALAHDEVTDLLHVGTSAGRSVFQGLRRIENTTNAVGTAISAYDGLVVEE